MPDCLKRPGFEFCKAGWARGSLEQILPSTGDDAQAKSVLEQFKRPRGTGWETNTYSWDSPGLLEWMNLGGNYGVVAGSLHEYEGQQARLFIMDADDPPALAEAGFQDELPRNTLRVKTGRIDPAGGHIYFLSDISSKKAHYELPGYCHFKFYHSQVIGPGSLHPAGRRYEVIDDHQPAYVDEDVLVRAIITATQALCPDKVKEVKAMLGAKTASRGMSSAEKTAQLEAVVREAKLARIKQNQQQEAATEEAYKAFTGQNAALDGQQTISNEKEAAKAGLGDVFLDEKINPCLKRLTSAIAQRQVARFEQAIGYEGKAGEGEHALRLAWATALVKSGYDDDQIQVLCQNFDDYNPSRTQQQLDSVRRYVDGGGDYHPCKTLKTYIPGDWCTGCRWTPPQGNNGDALTSSHDIEGDKPPNSEIEAEAKEIIEAGQFPEYWVKVFLRRHNGDTHVALAMPAANLTSNISNSHGVAVLQVAGDSGDGKSHAVQTVAEQMGKWCDISGLSPMALLYHAGRTVFGGMMVVMDDNRPDERQGDIIKRAQTQFKTGYRYKTIIKGKPIELQMPAGVQLLTTEVDADSEDQVLNRTLLLEVKGSPEKDLAIIEADLDRLDSGDQPLDDPSILVCRAALDMLKSKTYVVTIPQAKKRIKWLERNKDQRANLRNYNIFVDMILAYAVMRWPQRIHYVDEAEVMHVEATKQDFMDALALYHAVHKQMKTKLTSKELDLLSKVKEAGGRILKEDAQRQLGVSRQRLDALCRGKNGQGGLLGKYPGFYIEEATENEADVGRGAGEYSTRHVKKKYLCLTNIDLGQAHVDGSSMAAEWVEG